MTQETTMPANRSLYKTLPAQLTAALKDFQTSQVPFRLLQTVNPQTLTPQPPPASTPTPPPQTLLILDSSFNPPSIAHQTLALSALSKTSSTSTPPRLLLLFSTMNADKAPTPAPFPHRLTLMTLLAIDLLTLLQKPPYTTTHQCPTAVDIAVTTAPYYTDKTAAIATSPEGQSAYPGNPKHVHLLGFDTLTRFFNPKYYAESHSPPLSALEPYFAAGHGLRATLRPEGDDDESAAEQRAFVQGLAEGALEGQGGRREWAGQVEVVEAVGRAGVSSTAVRRAAKRGDWGVVGELCSEGVAGYVREAGLYEEDDSGAKMA